MRTLSANTFLTLDGVMQAPGGPQEDPTGGFSHGGWSAGYWDDAMMARMGEIMGNPFDLLLGRKTYEIFAAHWPYAESPDFSLNKAKKYVASRTLASVEWQNSELLRGDVIEAVKTLKAQDGPEIQIHGSADLLQTLIKNDVIDEFRIWLFPLVIGRGKRLFGDGTVPAGLRLAHSETFGTGVVVATYARAGEIKAGSFALEEPTEAELKRREKIAAG
jgi:dihydrofolate reductase